MDLKQITQLADELSKEQLRQKADELGDNGVANYDNQYLNALHIQVLREQFDTQGVKDVFFKVIDEVGNGIDNLLNGNAQNMITSCCVYSNYEILGDDIDEFNDPNSPHYTLISLKNQNETSKWTLDINAFVDLVKLDNDEVSSMLDGSIDKSLFMKNLRVNNHSIIDNLDIETVTLINESGDYVDISSDTIDRIISITDIFSNSYHFGAQYFISKIEDNLNNLKMSHIPQEDFEFNFDVPLAYKAQFPEQCLELDGKKKDKRPTLS